MKRAKRIIVLLLIALLIVTSAVGCSNKGATNSTANSGGQSTKSENAPDTITALLPPITPNFQKNLDQISKDFHEKYPNLTLKIEPASWEDMTQKLDVQVNAGTPPDIAFIGSDGIGKYAETGELLDISKIVTKEMVDDFDPIPLEYMKVGKGLYGFPAYMEPHNLGGNKQFLEEAGIDWRSVQKIGWTFDEFRKAIKKGTIKNGNTTTRYGFVFACSGVAAVDYISMFANNAGMPSPFTKDLKYAYTSKNFLKLLEDTRLLIDDGSMPNNLSSVTAAMRWNMFLTGQTMITGKAMEVFEKTANDNNAKLEAKDPSAVQNSIKVDYVNLPVPTFFGNKNQTSVAVDGYVTFRGKKAPSEEHIKNVVKAAYFLASGKIAAETCADGFLPNVTKSGREASKDMQININPDNLALQNKLLQEAAPARPDIPIELSAKANKLMNEVIVPRFQALLSNEITPQQMYDDVKNAAIQAFGEDGIVKD
jgi:multiple sugar transport system substrate-binding protein